MRQFDFFRGILVSLLLMVSTIVNAHDFEVDGIYYNYESDNTVSVTYFGTSYYGNKHEYSGNVVIPKSVTYNGVIYRITSIGGSAFKFCSGLTSIVIPNSVTSIGEDAFFDCSGLTSITIPNSVTSIGKYAFYGCSGLTSITIPNSVTSIGERAFSCCSGLTSIFIGNGITSIDCCAFWSCDGLTEVRIKDMTAWCKIDFGDRESNPLYNEAKLYLNNQLVKDLIIPDNVTSIGSYAFYGCSSLTSIAIANNVTSVGRNAFNMCFGLTSVTIGNNVTSIHTGAFTTCPKLTSIEVDEDNPIYDSRNNCNAIVVSETNELEIGCKNTTIPNSVTSIGGSAFIYCSGLTSIAIPNSVTSIGSSAFALCSGLTSITIPNSVTEIDKQAFAFCI